MNQSALALTRNSRPETRCRFRAGPEFQVVAERAATERPTRHTDISTTRPSLAIATGLGAYRLPHRRQLAIGIELHGGTGVLIGDLSCCQAQRYQLALAIYELRHGNLASAKSTFDTLDREGAAASIAYGPLLADGRCVVYGRQPLALVIRSTGAVEWLTSYRIAPEQPIKVHASDLVVWFVDGVRTVIGHPRPNRYVSERTVRFTQHMGVISATTIADELFERITVLSELDMAPVALNLVIKRRTQP